MGMNSTITKITDRYWWPGMCSEIRAFVRECGPCQKSNPNNRPAAALLHPVKVSHIFHRWGIDLVGPSTKQSQE